MLKRSERNIVTVEKKQECPLEGKCRSEDIIHKCVVTATVNPRKVYLGTAKVAQGAKNRNNRKKMQSYIIPY